MQVGMAEWDCYRTPIKGTLEKNGDKVLAGSAPEFGALAIYDN